MRFRPEGYKCKRPLFDGRLCNRTFATPQKLGYHTVAEHRGPLGPEIAEWIVGQKKRFREQGEACPWCGKMFYTVGSYTTHLTTDHAEQICEQVAKLKNAQVSL